MAGSTSLYIPTHRGAVGAFAHSDLITPDDKYGGRAPDGGLASLLQGWLFNHDSFPIVGGIMPYTAAQWTVTTTGTGAAVAQAITAGGGILLTAGSTSTFNTNLESKAIWAPVASKRVVAIGRVQTSDITTVGFEFNFGNSQVDPATTNYTDVIGLKMAVGAGTVIGKVRGNSGTVANSSTLATLAATTDYFFGFTFNLSATAGLVDGGFFAGSNLMSATYTAFSSAQKVQAAAILTSPPTMYLNLHCKGSAGNPTTTFTSVLAHVDN